MYTVTQLKVGNNHGNIFDPFWQGQGSNNWPPSMDYVNTHTTKLFCPVKKRWWHTLIICIKLRKNRPFAANLQQIYTTHKLDPKLTPALMLWKGGGFIRIFLHSATDPTSF